MPHPTRQLIGMLTPSSNTILEPLTSRMLAQLPTVSAHFGRFRVTQIGLDAQALAQFALGEIMRAASLLADAKCQVIAWNGTSASWLGHETDHALCRAISAETGAAACTAVLALNELLEQTGARRIALVTPYVDDVQARIIANYAKSGITVVAEVHFGLSDNFSFSEVSEATITAAIQNVAAAKPDAIIILCTNLKGAGLAAAAEAEFGIPVYDSVSAVLWKALALCGENPAGITGWGGIFNAPAGSGA